MADRRYVLHYADIGEVKDTALGVHYRMQDVSTGEVEQAVVCNMTVKLSTKEKENEK